MYDLQHRIAYGSSVVPGTYTTTQTGSSVDALGYESVTLQMQVAAIGGTSPSFTPKIQTSSDNSTWTDLDATAYIGGAAPAAMTANGSFIVGVQSASGTGQGPSRYFRAVITVAGTTPTAATFASFILSHPRHSGNAV